VLDWGTPSNPFTLTVPAIVTLPEAKRVTGVLLTFGVKVRVTPAGMFTVV